MCKTIEIIYFYIYYNIMGIKNLLRHMREKYGYSATIISLDDLANCTIAVDAPTFLYTLKGHPAWKKHLEDVLKSFVSRGIRLIFVLEGKSPNEKSCTQQKRSTTMEQSKNKTIKFRALQTKMIKGEELAEEDRRFWTSCNNTKSVNFKTVPITEKALSKIITQREKNENIRPTPEDWKYLSDVAKQYYTVYQADGEAEQFCARLFHSKKCDYVWSTDSDTLAYGVECVISKITGNDVHVHNLKDILSKIDLTFEQFLKFCIGCGCDYNNTVPNMGPVKLREQIVTSDLTEEHRKILSFDTCKKIFMSAYEPIDFTIPETQHVYTIV